MTPINEEISSLLLLYEEVLWSGQPKQGVTFRRSDLFAIPFSLFWCGFAIFWEFSVIQGDDDWSLILLGIPFVLIGLYMLVGRFFSDAKQRAKTFYAVTNQRILISSGIFKRSAKSLDLRKLTTLSLEEGKHKEGNLSFGASSSIPSVISSLFPVLGLFAQKAPRFELIKNPKQVYETIVAAQYSGS
jgi:hypothetical protein